MWESKALFDREETNSIHENEKGWVKNKVLQKWKSVKVHILLWN